MTKREAIEIIERRINNLEKSLPFAEKYINALKMAVDALEDKLAQCEEVNKGVEQWRKAIIKDVVIFVVIN